MTSSGRSSSSRASIWASSTWGASRERPHARCGRHRRRYVRGSWPPSTLRARASRQPSSPGVTRCAAFPPGCIDVLRPPSRTRWTAMADLPGGHPYRLVGKEGYRGCPEVVQGDHGRAALSPMWAASRKNREILTPIGTFKTTCLVPRTMAASHGCRDEYVHVISFKGIKDFYPSYITSKLTNTGFSLYDAGVSSTLAIATRFEEQGLASMTSAHMARRARDPARQGCLAGGPGPEESGSHHGGDLTHESAARCSRSPPCRLPSRA
ncbi:MAG: hypothetical protein MZU95_09690 [Desulfomicrobium escambiense]|nr:hypothetical protein [Desulfomicrobium escambiense]